MLKSSGPPAILQLATVAEIESPKVPHNALIPKVVVLCSSYDPPLLRLPQVSPKTIADGTREDQLKMKAVVCIRQGKV